MGHLGFKAGVLFLVSGEDGRDWELLPNPFIIAPDSPHATSVIDFCGGLGSIFLDLKNDTICLDRCASASRA